MCCLQWLGLLCYPYAIKVQYYSLIIETNAALDQTWLLQGKSEQLFLFNWFQIEPMPVWQDLGEMFYVILLVQILIFCFSFLVIVQYIVEIIFPFFDTGQHAMLNISHCNSLYQLFLNSEW